MATGQTVIDQIRDELQDTDDVSFSDAELLRYINRGAKEFCVTTGCILARRYIDTDATNFIFSLSSNLANPTILFAVEFNGIPLSRTYKHEITYEFGASSGTPTAWYETSQSLIIDLVAPTATDANALSVWYFRIPTIMTAVNNTFDFPDEWESAIVAYALARCYNAQRDSVLEAKQMVKYETLRQSALAINKWKFMGDAS